MFAPNQRSCADGFTDRRPQLFDLRQRPVRRNFARAFSMHRLRHPLAVLDGVGPGPPMTLHGLRDTPLPADYESSILADAHSSIYLRERETNHFRERRPDRVFALTMLESNGKAVVIG